VILPDGNIFMLNVVESSGSRSLDAAGAQVFRGAFVRPFPEGEPKADVDISLHYVLAHRHDQPVGAGYTPVLSKGPFTIMNDPVKSPILDTMLQRTCTGTEVKGGIKNHPEYGMRSWVQVIFFRKPDGTPWVKFYEGGNPSLSPVTEVGKTVQWTVQRGQKAPHWIVYTVWPDGDNHLGGATGSLQSDSLGVVYSSNIGGPIDLTCATEILPAVIWNDAFKQSMVAPPGDPP